MDEYINASISKIEPIRQKGKTCYAVAIATGFHLATLRIHERDQGIPKF